MTDVADIEDHRVRPVDEVLDALGDLIDIDGIDLAPDGHDGGQVAAVRADHRAAALEGAIFLSIGEARRSDRDTHERPPFPLALRSSDPAKFCLPTLHVKTKETNSCV
ncbi:hypothetical protein NJB18091_46880 [Mycobacterium marinum]|nr:hypothetical protein NJB18091_46880 [Mycobacterium marinum]